jgi:hypothetical protein
MNGNWLDTGKVLRPASRTRVAAQAMRTPPAPDGAEQERPAKSSRATRARDAPRASLRPSSPLRERARA